MPRRALVAASAVLLVAFVALALPWLTREQVRVTSTPVPPPLYSEETVRLTPGQRACVAPVVFEPRTQVATILVRGGAPALRVTAAGAGYSAAATVPGGYAERAVSVRLSPPPRDVATTLCIADAGTGPVSLGATSEPRRATTRVDGRRGPENIVLTLQEGRERSIARYAGRILDHMTAFRPGIVTPGTVAVLLVLLIVLVAAGAPWAYARALSGDERSGPTE